MRKLFVVIDISSVADVTQLHRLLAEALDFPGWYGCNWDAFWDAITGLVDMPERLQFVGWKSFANRYPEDAHIMHKCLDNMSKRFPMTAAHVEYS